MDIAYQSEPNLLSIYITKTIQWNGMYRAKVTIIIVHSKIKY